MTSGDVRKKDPFGTPVKIQEPHKQPIYCLDWSTDLICHSDDNEGNGSDSDSDSDSASSTTYRILASCGGRHVHIYQYNRESKRPAEPLQLIQSYVDPDTDETFYTCVFAGRSVTPTEQEDQELQQQQKHEPTRATKSSGGWSTHGDDKNKNNNKNQPQPFTSPGKRSNINNDKDHKSFQLWPLSGETGTYHQFLCVAGHKAVINIIDTVRQRLCATLTGHGYEIYDLKVSPADEFILASASKDNTVRLWNLKTGCQIAVLSGLEGHLDDVVSLSWHSSGEYLATGSMDSTVKIWHFGRGTPVHRAIRRSHKTAKDYFERGLASIDRVAEQQVPVFTSQRLHFYCVDCVYYLGDLIISRSLEENIQLWQPLLDVKSSCSCSSNNDNNTNSNNKSQQSNGDQDETLKHSQLGGSQLYLPYPVPNQLRPLRTFDVQDTQYWFIRFGVDHCGRTLAIGTAHGDIYVWSLLSETKAPVKILDAKKSFRTATVRYISFSPDDTVMVAATDAGEIWKWNVNREETGIDA